ncbi:MAG: LamG domain-containing protein, partial [Bacteroidia bacterium]|nr:LamG domain-containing protein [Bacteroidia bacterium]
RFVIALSSHDIPGGQPGNLIFSVSDGKSCTPIRFKQIPTNEWIHLVLIFDKSSIKLYVNSKLFATETGVTLTPDIRAIPLRIGLSEGLGTPFFKGSIQEVKLYDRALTEKEIIEHHNSKTKSISSQKKGK